MMLRAEEALFGARAPKPGIAERDDDKGSGRRILESLSETAPLWRDDPLQPDGFEAGDMAEVEDEPVTRSAPPPKRRGRPPKVREAQPVQLVLPPDEAMPMKPAEILVAPPPIIARPLRNAEPAEPVVPVRSPRKASAKSQTSASAKSQTSKNGDARLKLGERWKRRLLWRGGKHA